MLNGRTGIRICSGECISLRNAKKLVDFCTFSDIPANTLASETSQRLNTPFPGRLETESLVRPRSPQLFCLQIVVIGSVAPDVFIKPPGWGPINTSARRSDWPGASAGPLSVYLELCRACVCVHAHVLPGRVTLQRGAQEWRVPQLPTLGSILKLACKCAWKVLTGSRPHALSGPTPSV